MLFWIVLVCLIAGFIWLRIDKFSMLATALLVVGLIGMAIAVPFLIVGHIGVDAEIAERQEIYKSLKYQLNNDLYDNDNDLGKKELFTEIQEWNKDLAWCKEVQDDFWIGIFIPNVFDEFEFIELEVE